MTATAGFVGVQEQDAFCALFPHRFDFIHAAYPDQGEKPDWQTESRYPLSDRVLLHLDRLYGVRFGAHTQYCLIDIDITSVYHPGRDALAIARIHAALEPLGLVSSIACTSSYSGGIHLYFPFQQSQRSWELALVVAGLLENAGFHLQPGQLEIFPNPRAYAPQGKLSLFHAHRLPLQVGSYLLNSDWQPVWGDRTTFVQRWQFAQHSNAIDALVFRRVLKQAKRKNYQLTGKADRFLADLNAEIELGWTGPGQTNRLLGRIALRTYVFHSVLTGQHPLTGQNLADEIVRVARSLPGYADWCNHQHEIATRAADWARCVEASRYFPYKTGSRQPDSDVSPEETPQPLSWNQQQSERARERIRRAIATLLDSEQLPATPTGRFRALTQQGISGSTLYRHKGLWHPEFISDRTDQNPFNPFSIQSDGDQGVQQSGEMQSGEMQSGETVEIPPYPPASEHNPLEDCVQHASSSLGCTSLFPENGCNPLQHQDWRDRPPNLQNQPGCNSCPSPLDARWVRSSDGSSDGSSDRVMRGDEGMEDALAAPAAGIGVFRTGRQAEPQAIAAPPRQPSQPTVQRQQADAQEAYWRRIQQFWESGDPILMAEARACLNSKRMGWSEPGA